MDKPQLARHRSAVGSLLREIRHEASLVQEEVAERLGRAQSYVSRYESGEIGLDLVELRAILVATGSTLPDFITRLEHRLPGGFDGRTS